MNALDYWGETSPDLLAMLKRATLQKMTADQMFEQRVSWCYGQQDTSSSSALSKDDIRAMLNNMKVSP